MPSEDARLHPFLLFVASYYGGQNSDPVLVRAQSSSRGLKWLITEAYQSFLSGKVQYCINKLSIENENSWLPILVQINELKNPYLREGKLKSNNITSARTASKQIETQGMWSWPVPNFRAYGYRVINSFQAFVLVQKFSGQLKMCRFVGWKHRSGPKIYFKKCVNDRVGLDSVFVKFWKRFRACFLLIVSKKTAGYLGVSGKLCAWQRIMATHPFCGKWGAGVPRPFSRRRTFHACICIRNTNFSPYFPFNKHRTNIPVTYHKKLPALRS